MSISHTSPRLLGAVYMSQACAVLLLHLSSQANTEVRRPVIVIGGTDVIEPSASKAATDLIDVVLVPANSVT